LSISIFEKTPLQQLFQQTALQNLQELNCKQLTIFD
jgi:hypothetical protein